jgi:pimeloyl-ACP methyl ester carboxylesterase
LPSYDAGWRQRLTDRSAEALAKGTAALVEGVLGAWFTAHAIARDGVEIQYVRRVFAATPAMGYARDCAALVGAHLDALVPRITAPTLVLCGDQDAPNFLSSAQCLQSTIPGTTLTWLAPGKHAALLERRDAFVTALRAHFA